MASRKKNPETLTQAAAQLLSKVLLPDLAERAEQATIRRALERQHASVKQAGRTAESLSEWKGRTLEQVAAAWILSVVFVRTLEDRGLLARRRIAGENATDSEQLFFELAPSLTARDYLLTVFEEIASLPGAEDVLGRAHNPAWRMSPSNDGARALLDFFRTRDASGELRWRFDGEDTRFLGDLYQDLSEAVRKRYALLQTPDFVESFILDHTLEPAIQTFGLTEVRLIDPTCGSGHFLLGAFERLVDHRLRTAPGTDVRTHAEAALGQIYGVDVNPFAVAIARFRLTLAYLQKAGFTQIAQAPKLKLNLVVADSLLHGAKDTNLRLTEQHGVVGDEAAWGQELFALDDPIGARRVFAQRYHAVVGNPPYITCKDKALSELYRKQYLACHREYSLAAPFTERFFQTAVDSGYVGMITANSFMKREFGKALIEKILPQLDLTRVIDSAGAYIPGHGTPTVLLFGRNQKPVGDSARAILGNRGEPSTPENPEQGLVWRSIVDHLDDVGFENEYVSVADVPRLTLAAHPWSLGGGGAAELKTLLESRADTTLGKLAELIGFGAVTREDELFALPTGTAKRLGVAPECIATYGFGEAVRDWSISSDIDAVFPYTRDGTVQISQLGEWGRLAWRFRTQLWLRQGKGFRTKKDSGGEYFEYSMFYPNRHFAPLKIAFAFVATHNHFVLDRAGTVFNRTAPIIKLPADATEDDHLALLAYLNSSTACFWMKQVFFDKGGGGIGGGLASAEWEKFYEFDGTKLRALPLPGFVLGNRELGRAARLLTDLASNRQKLLSSERCDELLVAAHSPEAAAADFESDAAQSRRMLDELIYLQEELDWWHYAQLGLVPNELASDLSAIDHTRPPDIASRPFLLRYARSASPLREIKRLFELCGMTATLNVADGAPLAIRDLWQRRVRHLDSANCQVELIERPENKRTLRETWAAPTTAARASEWLLDAAEAVLRRHDEIRPQSVRRVASQVVATRPGSIAHHLLCGGDTVSIHRLIEDAAAPAVSAYRFASAGIAKHSQWRRVWHHQRRQDLGEVVSDIPVPPKYDSKDYAFTEYWRVRGKLDVPKERFISYPGCEKDGDPSPLIGWAGWNHLQRAQALIALYQERKLEDGWDTKRLMPMLVGLHELMFWLELWHSEPEAGSENPAREFKGFLEAELVAHKLSTDDLEAWRPEKKKAAGRAKKKKPRGSAES